MEIAQLAGADGESLEVAAGREDRSALVGPFVTAAIEAAGPDARQAATVPAQPESESSHQEE